MASWRASCITADFGVSGLSFGWMMYCFLFLAWTTNKTWADIWVGFVLRSHFTAILEYRNGGRQPTKICYHLLPYLKLVMHESQFFNCFNGSSHCYCMNFSDYYLNSLKKLCKHFLLFKIPVSSWFLYNWKLFLVSHSGSSTFGEKPGFGGFVSSPNQSNLFGSGFQQSQTTLWSSPFGLSTSLGASTQNAPGAFGGFGTGNAFGAAHTSGASSNFAFGVPSNPAFGASNTSRFSFGTTTPSFGQSTSATASHGLFGTGRSIFGTQSSSGKYFLFFLPDTLCRLLTTFSNSRNDNSSYLHLSHLSILCFVVLCRSPAYNLNIWSHRRWWRSTWRK